MVSAITCVLEIVRLLPEAMQRRPFMTNRAAAAMTEARRRPTQAPRVRVQMRNVHINEKAIAHPQIPPRCRASRKGAIARGIQRTMYIAAKFRLPKVVSGMAEEGSHRNSQPPNWMAPIAATQGKLLGEMDQSLFSVDGLHDGQGADGQIECDRKGERRHHEGRMARLSQDPDDGEVKHGGLEHEEPGIVGDKYGLREIDQRHQGDHAREAEIEGLVVGRVTRRSRRCTGHWCWICRLNHRSDTHSGCASLHERRGY